MHRKTLVLFLEIILVLFVASYIYKKEFLDNKTVNIPKSPMEKLEDHLEKCEICNPKVHNGELPPLCDVAYKLLIEKLEKEKLDKNE